MADNYILGRGRLFFGDRLLGEIVPRQESRLHRPERAVETVTTTLTALSVRLQMSRDSMAKFRAIMGMIHQTSRHSMSKRRWRRLRGKAKAVK
jgi:hypothetical protein